MMFSKIFELIQNKSEYLYKNSFFLQKIDVLILISILAVIVSSVFMSSDMIGFIAIVSVFLTVVKLLTKRGEKLTFNHFELFLIAYFMLVVVSLFGSTLFALSLKGFLKTFIYIGFYFSVAHYLKNNLSKLPIILMTIALCIGFESIVAFFQNFAQVEEISTWQDVSNLNPEEVMTRVYGTLQPFNPNLLGAYFVSGIPSLFGICAYYFLNNNYKRACIALVLSLFSIIALFATGCRGAYLALLFILVCTFLVSAKFFWQNYKRIYMSIIGGSVLVFTFAVLFIASIRARFSSIFSMRADSSNSFRFNVYLSAIDMFKDNWLLGIGVGNRNFREIYGLYMKTGFDALSAYNIFLEIAVESGIFALVAFLGFLFVYVKDAVKMILVSVDKEKTIFMSVALISVLAVMFHGVVDTVFFRPQIQFIFWVMVATISAYMNNRIKNLDV